MKFRPCLYLLLLAWHLESAQPSKVERLTELGRLWVNVRYFHPYLAYRDIDWDAAFAKAVPKVILAASDSEYAAAVQGMLDALGDPVTRVYRDPASTPKSGAFLTELNSDEILVITVAGSDFAALGGKLREASAQISKARGIVFDLRAPIYYPPVFAQSGINNKLSSTPLLGPGRRTRVHHGYANADNSGSGGYHSSFQIADGEWFAGSPGAKDAPIVFLISERTFVPPIAVALHGAGKAAIVAEGNCSLDQREDLYRPKLPGNILAGVRLSELIYPDGSGIGEPDAVAGTPEEAMRVALSLAKQPKPPSVRKLLPAVGSRQPAHDPGGDYPDTGRRVLAAVQIWGVFNYFFPYKDLMGEDWDAVLRQFIPRMETARDAREYHLAVAEMVSHVHDSHAIVFSRELDGALGNAPPPIQVRWIENAPVITAILDDSAKRAGAAIGDIVLKVDGVEAKTRIDFFSKYISASTPQSLMVRALGRFLNGAQDSTVALTIRDRNEQVKEVRLDRSVAYFRGFTQRTGEIVRLLPGNIGYADLDRLTVSMVDAMFEQFKDTRAIVFDMRGYPHATAWAIAPRLAEKTAVAAALIEEPVVAFPSGAGGQFLSRSTSNSFVQSIPSTNQPRYRGRTVMLIDERAGSQAEHTGLFVEAANGTKFIGSRTAGVNGDVTYFSVPGGIRINFSGHGIRHADGRQLQRVGLVPDIEAKPTIRGIREGRDEVLERALDYLNATP